MTAATQPQVQLLSSAKLRITDRLYRVQPEPALVVLRAMDHGRRLIVTPTQADLLADGFAHATTAAEALARALTDGRCPPLYDFYELVVQAHAAGILQAATTSAPTASALRWPVRIPAPVALVVGQAVAVLAVVALAASVPQWRGPPEWRDVVGGWCLACLLLSVGQAVAACVIASRGEILAPRLHWRTRFPHFRIDVGEAIVSGRVGEAAVGVWRAAPILVGAAAVAWLAPAWLAPLCGGALFVLAPFGHSAARQWLASRRRIPPYSIQEDYQFAPRRADLWARGAARLRAFVAAFGWLGVAWSALWAAWMYAAFTRCMPRTVATVSAWVHRVPPPVHLGAEYLLLAVFGGGVLVWVWAGLRHWWLQRAWSRPIRGADARDPDRPPLLGEPADLLAAVPLFAEMDAESRTAVARAMTRAEFAPGDQATREDEPGDDFFLILEGELEVRKRVPGRRGSRTIGWLGPGDGFGEIALLENTTRTATLIARRPTRTLRLTRPDFEHLVVARVGAARVREILWHARFLGRLTFTAGWSFAELLRFARRCQSVRVEAGGTVIAAGAPNHFFYLIYDGGLEAREGERVLRRMGPGDYFGEISLLDDRPATASVVAIEESRCLALSRPDFIELFAHDFRIGLRIEALARARLQANAFRTS